MKRKIIAIVILCIFCLTTVLLVSCGGDAETSDTGTGADKNAVEENAADSQSEENPQKEDIFGVINSIAGNMLTIDYAVMPEAGFPVPQNRMQMPVDLENFDPDNFNLPEGVVINEDGSITMADGSEVRIGRGENGEGPVFSGDGPPEGFTPGEARQFSFGDGGEGMQIPTDENGEPIGRMFGSSEDGMGRTGIMGMRVFLEYTGENAEFILPVGIPIYLVTRDEEDNEVETEIELTDIKSGNVIGVTYREDGKTIDKIRISQIIAMNQEDMPNFEDMIRPDNMENAEESSENGETTVEGE